MSKVDYQKYLDAARGATKDADVVTAIAKLVAREVEAERTRSIAICNDRVELWKRTPAVQIQMEHVQAEARARANEATQIADLLSAGQDVVHRETHD